MWTTILSIGLISRYSFGFLSVLAFLLGSFAFWKKGCEEHYDEHELVDLFLVTVFSGLLGARLVYILIHFGEFGVNILYWLSLWSKPGLHWIGFFAGGSLAFLRFTRKHKWNYFKVFDLAVIGIALAQALVNLGIFLSGSALGKVTNLPFGVLFPGSFESRHPIGLYGFFFWLAVFGLLWWLEGKYRRFVWYQKFKGDSLPGFLSFVYLISFGLIGAFVSLLSETSLIYYGINLDFVLRILLVFLGTFGLLSRSGLVAQLGIDKSLQRFKKK